MIHFKRVAFFLLLVLLPFIAIDAQQQEGVFPPERFGIDNRFLPAVSFNSDMGFIGGGVYNRFNYGLSGVRPYESYTLVAAIISTRGFASASIMNDKVNAFGSDWRIMYSVGGGRFFRNNFFGIGNYSQFNQELFDSEYFFYDSYDASVNVQARYPILRPKSRKDPLFDVYLRASGSYQTTQRAEISRLSFDRPEGIDGGKMIQLGGGIIYDNRDNELQPSTGWRIDAEVMLASAIFGSDWTVPSWMLRVRRFLPVAPKYTIGLQYMHTQRYGEMPFWFLPSLGGENQMRGFAFNRFIGKGANSLSAELRGWVFEPKSFPIRFGFQLFGEAGRIVQDLENIDQFFQDYHHTYGGGIGIGFPDSDFILRVEYGISEDMGRTYITVNYAF